MTAQTRTVLKTYFETGDKPTQSQFSNLIDSFLSISDPAFQSVQSDILLGGALTVAGAVAFSSVVSAATIHLSTPAITDSSDKAASTAFAKTAPTETVLTSASGTYTTPSGALYLKVRMVGAGQGGTGSGTTPGTAGAGTNTTFGGSLTAQSGGNGGGATGASVAIAGGAGQSGNGGNINSYGGNGGLSAFGGNGMGGNAGSQGKNAQPNTGSGGGGAGCAATIASGAGGAAGGYLEKIITATAATYAYVVGAGGSGGTAGAGGAGGGNGGSGIIIVEEYYIG